MLRPTFAAQLCAVTTRGHHVGMVRIEGLDSIWRFDDVAGRYMRTPRVEAPRERPEWGDERAGACQDFVWHDLDTWWITDDHQRLVIVPVSFPPFWAPLTANVNHRRFNLWGELAGRQDGTFERASARLLHR